MALVYTPDGQAVVVPDGQAGMFGPPPGNPLELGPGPMPIINPIGEIPAGAPEPQSALPGLGPNGMVPNPYEQPAPMPPPLEYKGAPVGAPPQTSAGEVVNPFPTPSPAQKKQEQAAARQAQQQQAYANSPEGRIDAAEQAALRTNQQQQQTATQLGDVQAQEMDAIYRAKKDGIEAVDDIARNVNNENALWKQGVAERLAKVDKASTVAANMKVDPGRMWHNAGTGQKILAGISVALSGLGDVLMRKTGPNMALQIIQGAIKDDVEAQIRDKENAGKAVGLARNSLDDYRAQGHDLREAGQLKIAEGYKWAAADLETKASAFGAPKAKLAAKMNADQLRMDAAKILGTAAEAAYNRENKAKEMAMQRQSIGIAGGHLALAREQFAFNQENEKAQRANEAAKIAQAGQKELAAEYLKRGIGGTAEAVTDKDGNVTGTRMVPLKNRDGSLFIPTGSEASVDKLRNEKVATDRLVQIMDQVQAAGPEWLSDRANSDKLQRLKADWAAAKLEVKDVKQLGVIAGPDLDLIEDFLGTPDPTRWKDSKAGIERSRGNLVRGMNTRMQAHGFDGEYAPKALSGLKESTGDEAYKGLLNNTAGSDLGDRSITGMLTNISPAGAAKRQGSIAEGAVQAPELTSQVQALAAMARSGNNQAREIGYARLATLAQEAKSPVVKDLAAKALLELLGNDSFPTETPR
jgi:hypothetical protein